MAGRTSPDSDFWRHRSVAVTGGTGFLGSHLVGQLVDVGADVVVLVRDQVPRTEIASRWTGKVTEVSGDVHDQAVVERVLGEYGVSAVLHLAAQTQVEVANNNVISTFESNIAGTWTVLEACRRSPSVETVVTASSDKAYGSQEALPYTEGSPLNAINPYDVSKACADMISVSYARVFGVPVAVTRCGNFFGPGDTNWRRLVPGVIRDLLEGRRPVLRSDGSPVRDYLYVKEGALAYLRLAEALAMDNKLVGETFNFSSGRPMSVLEMTRLLADATGVALDPDIQSRASNEIQDQHLSSDKAHRLLEWAPQYEIKDAITETVAWYRAHLTNI